MRIRDVEREAPIRKTLASSLPPLPSDGRGYDIGGCLGRRIAALARLIRRGAWREANRDAHKTRGVIDRGVCFVAEAGFWDRRWRLSGRIWRGDGAPSSTAPPGSALPRYGG